ncbi:cytochrome P450 [Streptomyces uncialis]|uniref:cytochrome P450 n=1 Tax=Streptomyces uncialis TaxID=1048205 RepID=UPI00379D618E|nr:cytochrome P450 [Streptomyces uncialis]
MTVLGTAQVAPAPGRDVLELLMSPPAHLDPYPVYAWLRENAPVYASKYGAYLISRYADVQYVLKHPEVFPGASEDAMAQMFPQAAGHEAYQVLVTSLVGSNPPKHTRLRGLIGKEFTSRRVGGLRAAVESLADRLVGAVAERLRAGDTVDLHTALSLPMPLHVISDLLGIPSADRSRLAVLVPAMMNVVDPAASPEAVEAADAAFRELGDYLGGLIAERRSTPRDDLISALVLVHDDDYHRLSDSELRTLLFTLWSAGFETTATGIDNALLALIERPETRKWLLGDESSAAAFVEETLRHDPSVQVAPGIRFAATDTVLSGVTIPQGTQVRLMLGAASRDPAACQQPDDFVPGRDGATPLSFGAGIHYCLGAGLSRLEMTVLLPRLQRALPALALDGPPGRRRSIPLRDFTSLKVRLAE